jgi:hypothetical protein
MGWAGREFVFKTFGSNGFRSPFCLTRKVQRSRLNYYNPDVLIIMQQA